MISLRYLPNGELRQEKHREWTRPAVLVHEPRPVELFPMFRTLSHRERRRRARKGRKFPRHVPARVPHDPEPTFPSADIKRFCAHQLRRGSEDVLLYLPEGEEVTEAHCRGVARWLEEQTPRVTDAAIGELIDRGYRVTRSGTGTFVASLFGDPISGVGYLSLNAAFAECLEHSRQPPPRGA